MLLVFMWTLNLHVVSVVESVKIRNCETAYFICFVSALLLNA